MKNGHYYRHKEALDAYIKVDNFVETTPEGKMYNISWYVNGKPLWVWHKALITPEQEMNWLECDEMGKVSV